MKNILKQFTRLFDLSGYSTRNEFWTFYALLIFAIIPITSIVFWLIPGSKPYKWTLNLLYIFLLFAITFRRLKDAGFSGWLTLVPIINIVLALFPSKYQERKQLES